VYSLIMTEVAETCSCDV